jgi:UDP-glucose 4-epimerase
MRIAITGGAGFIASHIADAYIKQGHRVAIIDNLLTGFRKNVHPKAVFYRADIRNRKAIDRIFHEERPEIVNHHAAVAEVVKSLRDPVPTYETNILGTANVLVAFGAYGRGKHKKFLFSSTGGAIYGEPRKIPADERTAAVPLSPYGLSKLLGEQIIAFYAKSYNFEYLIFRYPNVYGPRQNPKGEAGVVAIFGGLMKSGKTPVIFGDGTKTRDYTHVHDIVRANLIALRRGSNTIVNLGWGKRISDQMIFDAVSKATGVSRPPRYAPHRRGEVYQIALDARRAGHLLGWKPRIRLENGIRKTVTTL